MLTVAAVHEKTPNLFRKLTPRGLEVEPEGGRQLLDLVPEPRPAGLSDHRQTAAAKRALGVDHQLLGIDLAQIPETGARGTGTLRRVERKQARRHLGQGEPALGTGVTRRENNFLPIFNCRQRQISTDPEGGFDGVGEAGRHILPYRQTIDDHLDGMLTLRGELRRVGGLDDLTVHPRPDEALPHHLREDLPVLSLASLDDRREEHESSPIRQVEDTVDHLLHALGQNRNSTIRAFQRADGRPQQTEVVVDLRHRADGRPRVTRGGLLLDGNGRRKPFDGIDVRLFHLVEKLAGVGRQRFHVASLTFGKERVEGQRRLAGTGDPSDHDHPVAWNGNVDVGQVVLARTANDDLVLHRSVSPCPN